jgi:hypothetical protein
MISGTSARLGSAAAQMAPLDDGFFAAIAWTAAPPSPVSLVVAVVEHNQAAISLTKNRFEC